MHLANQTLQSYEVHGVLKACTEFGIACHTSQLAKELHVVGTLKGSGVILCSEELFAGAYDIRMFLGIVLVIIQEEMQTTGDALPPKFVP